ncbi:MAG: class I SAM-dependent methyltransferase [Burkholderiales bacterium]|nr:class I SAM-dependent methyltransferase [Burkholderiales bacterium]
MNQSKSLTSVPRNVPSTTRLFLKLLANLKIGHLQLITPDGNCLMFGDLHTPPNATLQIKDWRACPLILRTGDIGFAESYERNWIETTDLTGVFSLALRNEAQLERVLFGAKLATLWYRLRHFLRPNTRKGSRRNIHAHYDIGNDFYRLWLDQSWTYSAAVFDGDFTQTLAQAQARKYQRIIDKLALRAGDKVLEIGCGWGGFAEHAARRGIYVHGITISPSQLNVAKQRIAASDLQEFCDLQLCDYRDLRGQYDAIVSIEMFEAVGERFWGHYFDTVSRRLKPGGKALIQSITINDSYFERYRSSTDFIQQYIFPGGMLPSPERFCAKAEKSRMQTLEKYEFGQDYAETLRRWRKSFEAEYEVIRKQGFDDRFIRIWRMYFAYCEAGFDEGRTKVIQFLMSKV